MARRKPLYPVPEAIPRPDITGPYDIEDGYASSVDLAKAKMVVSTGGACKECGLDHARASRIHELGHTAFTPKDWQARVKRTKDKLPVDLVNACEDARIYTRRARGGLEVPPPQLCEVENEHYHVVRHAMRSGNLLHLAGLIVAAHRSGDEGPIQRAVERLAEELAAKDDPAERLKGTYLQLFYSRVLQYAYYNLEYRKATFRHSLALARDLVRLVSDVATRLARELEQQQADEPISTKAYGHGKVRPQPADVRFGKLEVVRLPLPNRSKAGFDRRWTARDEGDIPTRFDRWSIDKRVFRAKKKAHGAALLVDVSGSMSWSEAHLARVLDEVPAATIALYSGSGDTGRLVIVAHKGRCATMTSASRFMYGGNVVDGPALQWLADQPEHVKLWMSDGGITGIGDGSAGSGGREYCGRILRKGGIQQVRNAAQVMEVLTGKRPFVPSKSVNDTY